MKKFISVILSFLMVLSVAVPAFAVEASPASKTVIDIIPDSGDKCVIVYHLPDGYTMTKRYSPDDEITAYRYDGKYSYYSDYSQGNSVLCGWSTEKGGEVDFYIGDVIPFAQRYDLYPVFTEVMLDMSELYTFRHHFDTEGYYMNDEDYDRLIKSLYDTMSYTPLYALAIPGSIVLSTMKNWEWRGSCYGISTTVVLQHLGKLDILSSQNAQCVNDLVLDDKLMSTINYYQAQAGTSFLCENHGYVPGSAIYKTQLKNLIKTVKNGNIALLTVGDVGSPINVIADAHTVVPCGTYDRNDGTHILIVYDCNVRGFAQFIVAPDYSWVKSVDKEFGPIGWTDDFTHFDSFDINGNSNEISWHAYFIRHLVANFKTLISSFFVK